MDAKGNEVWGEDIKRVWEEAFEKLGRKEGDDGGYDEQFAESIEREEKEIEKDRKKIKE